MTEEMKAIIESNEKHIIVQAKAGCLPSNTKYFNGKEWKFISEYEEGELVLQFNPNNFKTKLVKPCRYIKQTNDTGWYKISLESGNSIVCSGNHDILYYDDNLNPLKCKPMEFRKGSIAVIPNTELIKERACKLDKVLSIDKIDIGNTMEYCFTVNSGNLVVNQNGFIFTTGNCGKTSTIKEYIKSHPNEKILYTVFSSEMKKEADRSFKGLKNVEVRTFHSLAYRWWVNKNKNTRYLGLDYKQMLKQFKETTQLELKNMFVGYDLEYEDLKYILFYYNMYLCSDKLNIDDLELLDEEHEKYLQFVQMIYDYHKNHYVPVPHNFYLKEYSLSNPVLDVDTLLSDECLDGDMYVKTDKGNIKIKTIHKMIQNGEKLKALSFNHDYEVFEYKSITNSKETLDREIFEIRTEGLNKLRCTDNHRVLTQEGYVEVRDLIVGKHQLILDNTFNQKTKYKLNNDQISMLIGSYLGDGHIDKRSIYPTYRISFTHGIKQLNYLKTKSECFGIDNDKIKVIKSGYTNRKDIFQSNNSKTFILDEDINLLILNRFNEKALAIWFMDDGSTTKQENLDGSITYYSKIDLGNKDEKTIETLLYILHSKFGFNNLKITKYKNKYSSIGFSKENSKLLYSLVSKYIHEDLFYKIPKEYIPKECYKWNCMFKNYGGNYISSINKVKTGSVYDITVEDNHNFITLPSNASNKSSGMIVHNCQDLSDASLNILLSNLDKKIIAVGDSAQSIFNFMHCKNSLKVLKEKYGFKEYKLTNSFRISDTVAEMCSRLLKWFYEEDMGFRGENITKVVKLDILEDYGEPITILSRTRIGGLLEVLNILDKFEDAKIYYYGGLEKYDLKIIENMINNKGFFFIDGERFHVNQLRKMVKEGLDDPVIKGIISRYDFIMKNEDCIELLKRTEVKSIDEANFCVNTLHSCKGSTYSIVKLAEDIGGVGNIKLRYRHYKENNLTYQAREMENQINLLYVGLSRATKYLDIGKAFVKEDKIGDVFELRESLK